MTPFRSVLLSLTALALLQPLPLRADPSLECEGDSQVEIKNCLAETEQRVDRALATALQIARERAGELDRVTQRAVAVPALAQGQAAWRAYRDSHCDYIGATFGGGSGSGIAIRDCRITLTRQRIAQLLGAGR